MPHIVIIGGGIVGSATALALARMKTGRITVLEKESSLGRHASGRNSGVVHSGINQKPGTLKAKMCVEGSRVLREYCRKHGVPMEECGTLVVARGKKEEDSLAQLLAMGRECGVPGLTLLGPRELEAREPRAVGTRALYSPTGAIVDPVALLESVAQEAQSQGVEYHLERRVLGIHGKRIETSGGGVFEADHIVNCAGLYADKIAHQMGAGRGYSVIPFRGEYWEVQGCEVRSVIYPVPDLRFPFLGIHLTKRTDGRVLAGPSATLSFGREAYRKEWVLPELVSMVMSRPFQRMICDPAFLRLAVENAASSLSKRAFWKDVCALVPEVKIDQLVPAVSGIRAQIVDSHGQMVHDILIHHGHHSTHVLNAISPGMTSSLVFGEYLADEIFNHISSRTPRPA